MSDDLYPEHAKLTAISDQSQACYDFIAWLGDRGILLREWNAEARAYMPSHQPMRTLLAEHFGIDMFKIEQEKRAMLDALRKAADDGPG